MTSELATVHVNIFLGRIEFFTDVKRPGMMVLNHFQSQAMHDNLEIDVVVETLQMCQ